MIWQRLNATVLNTAGKGIRSPTCMALLAVIPWLLMLIWPSLNECTPNSAFYYFWPQNFKYAGQLFSSSYSRFDICLFLNINAYVSMFMLAWFAIGVVLTFKSSYIHSDRIFLLSIAMLITSVVASMASFKYEFSFYDLLYDSPMPLNIFKSWALISMFYISAKIIVGHLITTVRRRF